MTELAQPGGGDAAHGGALVGERRDQRTQRRLAAERRESAGTAAIRSRSEWRSSIVAVSSAMRASSLARAGAALTITINAPSSAAHAYRRYCARSMWLRLRLPQIDESNCFGTDLC